MVRIIKKIRFIAFILCLLLIYMAFEPWNFVMAQEKSLVKPAEKLAKKFDEIKKLVDENKIENIEIKTKEIEIIDLELKEEFKQTEEFLKNKGLNTALQRHKEFVENYNNKFSELKEKIEKAKGQEPSAISELKEFIKKNKHEKKEKPVDPEKLPHRTAPVKKIEMIEYKEEKPKIPELKKKDSRLKI